LNGRSCKRLAGAASLRFSNPDAGGLLFSDKDYFVMRRREAKDYTLIVVEMGNGKRVPDGSLSHRIKSWSHSTPTTPELTSTAALVWYHRGQLDEALKDLGKTIELKAAAGDAYDGRGNVYVDLGEFEKAITDFSWAIAISPERAGAYTNRGIARQVNWQTDEAIADYSKAIELSPNAVEAYHNRGTAWLEKSEAEKAIRDFDPAIALGPGRAASYTGRGKARDARGDIDGAIADYTKAIQLEPVYALAYAHRAVDFASKGRSVEAARDYHVPEAEPGIGRIPSRPIVSWTKAGTLCWVYDACKTIITASVKASSQIEMECAGRAMLVRLTP
jgi:tetratricopeptide (TPR) repeat protein